MKIALVTDAWQPQVNGVVTTLVELVRELRAAGHQVQVIEPGPVPHPALPGLRRHRPGHRARRAAWRSSSMPSRPDAIHLATEGPLGWAGRRYCLRRGLAFTTAFHTKFPEIVNAAIKVPVSWGYALLRHFHAPSSGVMVPTPSVLDDAAASAASATCASGPTAWTPSCSLRAEPGSLRGPGGRCRGRSPCSWAGSRTRRTSRPSCELELPGTKVVCGVGPGGGAAEATRHPRRALDRPAAARRTGASCTPRPTCSSSPATPTPSAW